MTQSNQPKTEQMQAPAPIADKAPRISSEQPRPVMTMTAEPLKLRGGGAGEEICCGCCVACCACEAFECFECCKGCCE